MGANPHLSANQAKVITEQEKCFDLREEGKSIREIARLTGLSRGTVQNRLDDEWIRRIGPRSDAARERQLAQIADAHMRLVEEKDHIAIGENPDTIAKLTNSQATLWDREAKLLGTYAPEKVSLTGGVSVEIPEQLRASIAAAEERARADALVREAAIRGRNGDGADWD